MSARRVVAVGLRARTARAVAVVVAATDDGPEVVRREELFTSDPRVPDSAQPHHAGLDLEPAEAEPIVQAAETVVRAAAKAAFDGLLAALRGQGNRVVASAVVGAPARSGAQLARIGNPHVRAHAAEGQLFRCVLQEAARARRIPCRALSDRVGFEEIALGMHCSEVALLRQLDQLGAAVGPPWRKDEKLACAGALLVLAEG